MPSSLKKITCSRIRRTDYAIVQLFLSMSAAADHEEKLYNQVLETVELNGKNVACKLVKGLTRTCIITNRKANHRINNTHAQLLLNLTVLAQEKKTFISATEVYERFNICIATLKDIIKVLLQLEVCYYDFDDRFLYDPFRIFEYLKIENGILYFEFGVTFRKTILRKGINLYFPEDILYHRQNTHNSLLTAFLLFVFSRPSLQKVYQKKSKTYNLPVSVRIKDLFSAAGIQPEEERLDNLRRWIWELLTVLAEYEEIDSIGLSSPSTSLTFGDSVEDFNDSRRLKLLGKTNSLMNTTIDLHFVVD